MDTQNGEEEDIINIHELVSSSEVEAIGDNVGIGVACFSEKVSNLNIFVMRLETLEGEMEALVLENDDDVGVDSVVEKVLEFDLLCGVLDSEVGELDVFLDTLVAEVAHAQERMMLLFLSSENSLCKEKLLDNELCLKQSEEQFCEIKKQRASFHRTLSTCKRDKNANVEEGDIVREDDQSLSGSTEIKMQTIEEQRNILRMLEKSIASEMDLEKNVSDSRKIEEKLNQRVVSLEQELTLMEEEASDVCGRWFEADNASETLMGISKGLLGRLQISQFNLNGLSQRVSELRAKLESASSLEKQLKESEFQLLNMKALADEYQKLYNDKCSEIIDMENLIHELKENASDAESRANIAEAECKLLKETNTELSNELTLMKDAGVSSETVESLERRLKESDLRLQQALASAEASQEKQAMLYSTINDMEHVIKDLKSKVSKSESLADSAEEKCIILSESNAELNEEVNFLRSRLKCLEGSLHQVANAKVATAKDITKQIKIFKTLVTQLAVERERLYKQLAFLASENKILVLKLKQTCKDPSQEVCPTSVTGHEVDKTWKNLSANDNEVESADPIPDAGTVRRIDAGVLSFKCLFISVLVLLISAAMFLFLSDVNFDVSL